MSTLAAEKVADMRSEWNSLRSRGLMLKKGPTPAEDEVVGHDGVAYNVRIHLAQYLRLDQRMRELASSMAELRGEEKKQRQTLVDLQREDYVTRGEFKAALIQKADRSEVRVIEEKVNIAGNKLLEEMKKNVHDSKVLIAHEAAAVQRVFTATKLETSLAEGAAFDAKAAITSMEETLERVEDTAARWSALCVEVEANRGVVAGNEARLRGIEARLEGVEQSHYRTLSSAQVLDVHHSGVEGLSDGAGMKAKISPCYANGSTGVNVGAEKTTVAGEFATLLLQNEGAGLLIHQAIELVIQNYFNGENDGIGSTFDVEWGGAGTAGHIGEGESAGLTTPLQSGSRQSMVEVVRQQHADYFTSNHGMEETKCFVDGKENQPVSNKAPVACLSVASRQETCQPSRQVEVMHYKNESDGNIDNNETQQYDNAGISSPLGCRFSRNSQEWRPGLSMGSSVKLSGDLQQPRRPNKSRLDFVDPTMSAQGNRSPLLPHHRKNIVSNIGVASVSTTSTSSVVVGDRVGEKESDTLEGGEGHQLVSDFGLNHRCGRLTCAASSKNLAELSPLEWGTMMSTPRCPKRPASAPPKHQRWGLRQPPQPQKSESSGTESELVGSNGKADLSLEGSAFTDADKSVSRSNSFVSYDNASTVCDRSETKSEQKSACPGDVSPACPKLTIAEALRKLQERSKKHRTTPPCRQRGTREDILCASRLGPWSVKAQEEQLGECVEEDKMTLDGGFGEADPSKENENVDHFSSLGLGGESTRAATMALSFLEGTPRLWDSVDTWTVLEDAEKEAGGDESREAAALQ